MSKSPSMCQPMASFNARMQEKVRGRPNSAARSGQTSSSMRWASFARNFASLPLACCSQLSNACCTSGLRTTLSSMCCSLRHCSFVSSMAAVTTPSKSETRTLSGTCSVPFSTTRPSPGRAARTSAHSGSWEPSSCRSSCTVACGAKSTWKTLLTESLCLASTQVTRTQGLERPAGKHEVPPQTPPPTPPQLWGIFSQSSAVRAPTRPLIWMGALACMMRCVR
mmetsp:Transcript_106860/g.344832  ORF Transcript_106860/g.344832 Transcript_106860/m.344832 type:complete len:223 (-) Transcript_106860:1648-2316(-)